MTSLGTTRSIFRLNERRREYIAFLLFILPNTALLLIWIYWPLIDSLYLSTTSWNLLSPEKPFVGLDNYLRLLENEDFALVLKNTVYFTFGVVFVRLALSLALAVLLNQRLVLRGFWRLIIFSPHITPSGAMALVWLSIYDPNYGPLENILSSFGGFFPNVLADTELVLPALIVVGIWKGLGFSTVIYLAALQGVDRELRDAAAVDGANAWQAFWNVSFPAISPVSYFLVTTGLINTFQTFDLVQVMTQGGPANASMTYVFHLYREAFHYYRMGMASTVAVVFLVIMMGFTLLSNQFAKRWVHY